MGSDKQVLLVLWVPEVMRPITKTEGVPTPFRRLDTPAIVPISRRVPADQSTHQNGLARFPVLAAHLLQNDRMPLGIALIHRDVIFARPAAESEFLDEVQVRHYADADHGSTLPSRPARPYRRTGRGSADH